MDEISADLHDQPRQVEGSSGVGREQRTIVPSDKREGTGNLYRTLVCPNWKLCDLFGIERSGPEFYYTEVEWGVDGAHKGIKHLEETKQKISRTKSKPVTVNGVTYKSRIEARRKLHVRHETLMRMIDE